MYFNPLVFNAEKSAIKTILLSNLKSVLLEAGIPIISHEKALKKNFREDFAKVHGLTDADFLKAWDTKGMGHLILMVSLPIHASGNFRFFTLTSRWLWRLSITFVFRKSRES